MPCNGKKQSASPVVNLFPHSFIHASIDCMPCMMQNSCRMLSADCRISSLSAECFTVNVCHLPYPLFSCLFSLHPGFSLCEVSGNSGRITITSILITIIHRVTMMSVKSTHCPYFSPNIFNDTKCQNCFRTKEIHFSDALEKQRGTRSIVKCGYLFVSPPNYELAENRSKRWQRRYFILYDDGHLTYSLDEDPETVPQAVMDMNLVEEVIDADEVTGNQNAIGLRGPDQAVFIKSASRREKMWWFDILSRYPVKSGKKKSRAVSGFSAFPSAETRNEVKQQPMLWLCFAANLSLSLAAADPIAKDSAPSSNIHNNNNNNNNCSSSNINSKNKNGGSGNSMQNNNHANVNRGNQVAADEEERSQQRNWINSNLSKTSQLASIEVEEMRQKLNQARKELMSINKELRDSYANYDYLEIAYDKLRQQVRAIQEDRESELNLMRHRINDLTGKLRIARHSMSRSQQQQDRRRSEAARHKLSSDCTDLPKDFGGKLQDLEHKIGTIHLLMTSCDTGRTQSQSQPDPHPDRQTTRCPSPTPSRPALSRRLSHDSDCSDSHSMLLRLHELSASVRKISDSLILYCDNTKANSSNSPSSSSSTSSPCLLVHGRPSDSEPEETRF